MSRMCGSRQPATTRLNHQRKRSERFCPNDLVSLDSEFGQLNPAEPRSGPGPHVLATWVRKVSSARDVRNFSDP
jgi:hypothetical protein